MPRTKTRFVKSFSTQVITPKNVSGTCLASEADRGDTNMKMHKRS